MKDYIKYKEQILTKAGEATTQQSLLLKVIEEVLKGLDVIIWKTDRDGNIIRNDNGNPKVDWVKVFFNIGKLVGAFFAIKETYEKEIQ